MKRADGLRRVVVTGFGMVTPIGLDSTETWASMKEGKCGVSRIENFNLDDLYIHIAGEIKGFDPAVHVKSKKIQYGERYSWFAGRAADEAWAMSGLPTPYSNPYRSCCIIGSGAGGYSTVETAYRDLFIHNKRATHPLTLLRIIGSSASAHVGIEYGIKGPTFATCSACSTAGPTVSRRTTSQSSREAAPCRTVLPLPQKFRTGEAQHVPVRPPCPGA